MGRENAIQWKLSEEATRFNELTHELDEKDELQPDTIENLLKERRAVPYLINDLIRYIEEYEGSAEILDNQVRKLQERKARFKKRIDNIRSFLVVIMSRFNLKKMECPYGTISRSVREKSKLIVDDETAIMDMRPELFFSKPALDKSQLRDLLMGGAEIEGAHLEDIEIIMIRK